MAKNCFVAEVTFKTLDLRKVSSFKIKFPIIFKICRRHQNLVVTQMWVNVSQMCTGSLNDQMMSW